MGNEQAARALIGRIRYQVFAPDVTTMGVCPECGHRSRGSDRCARCLGRELETLCGDGSGLRYVQAMFRARDAEREVLRMVGGEGYGCG